MLAKQYNLTAPEVEPMILTDAEIEAAVQNELYNLKTHKAYILRSKGASEEEILKIIANTNWEEKIDRDKIIEFTNSAKHQKKWHDNQRKIEKENEEKKQKELIERCDAKYMFKLMQYTSLNELGKKLIVNDDNRHLITTLCFFLSYDLRFKDELGYDPNKGLLIRGISGIGKTHLVRCLLENQLNPILLLSLIEITDEIKSSGEFQINLGRKKIIYLDDVGTEEPNVKYYGTNISFFKNFIELCYLKNENRGFNNLIISTNNSFDELEEKYGFRVRSRIKDMFNIVDVTGKDMRGYV